MLRNAKTPFVGRLTSCENARAVSRIFAESKSASRELRSAFGTARCEEERSPHFLDIQTSPSPRRFRARNSLSPQHFSWRVAAAERRAKPRVHGAWHSVVRRATRSIIESRALTSSAKKKKENCYPSQQARLTFLSTVARTFCSIRQDSYPLLYYSTTSDYE